MEFALLIPILMLVVLGISEFARAYQRYNAQTSYANSAARFLAVGKPYTNAGTVPGGACVSVTLPLGTFGPGDPVRVDVKSTFNYLGAFSSILQYVDNKPPLTASPINGSATTRIEKPPTSTPVTPACP